MEERDRLTVVIFGATGNLTGDKLLPALEGILDEPVLGPALTILAVGRRELNDAAYYRLMSGRLKTDRLRGRIRYFRANVEEDDGLKDLGRFLAESGLDRGKLIFYCATPPRFFGTISRQLHRYGLAREEDGGPFRRVVFEKPLGEDARSAAFLLDSIYQNFRNDQVILIDHYLGKEAIQNLLVLRFFNNLYSTLRAELVSDIQITVSEEEGIGERGQYYDSAGVIKDMLQNHILQIVAFLTMERPLENTVADILENKLQAIHSVRFPTPLSEAIVIGQYRGYREEKHVRPDSRTPTYVAMQLHVAAGPLRGVPIFVRTGKALRRKHARIVIQFKPVISPVNGAVLPGNRIIVTIQPDAWIMLFFNHKIPGLTMDVKEVGQFFFREEAFVESPREGYQRLFSEIMLGHRLLFPRPQEVIASWEFADKLLARIDEEKVEMVSYPRGVPDLPESQEMLRRHGFAWYETWHEKGI
jgi:glucose-6-phosphate 1-dehydrogenase